MSQDERNAIHLTGLLAEAAAVCEQILATFHHADDCGPEYYQLAKAFLNRLGRPT